MADNNIAKRKYNLSREHVEIEGNLTQIDAHITGISCNGVIYSKESLASLTENVYCDKSATLYMKNVSLHRVAKPFQYHKDPSIGNQIQILDEHGLVKTTLLMTKHDKMMTHKESNQAIDLSYATGITTNERTYDPCEIEMEVSDLTILAGALSKLQFS